jgi:hypothetical protein
MAAERTCLLSWRVLKHKFVIKAHPEFVFASRPEHRAGFLFGRDRGCGPLPVGGMSTDAISAAPTDGDFLFCSVLNDPAYFR